MGTPRASTSLISVDAAKGINRILDDWDPLGIVPADRQADLPFSVPNGEYTEFISGIYFLLENGAVEEDIIDHLSTVAHAISGSPVSLRDQKVYARRIIQWYRINVN